MGKRGRLMIFSSKKAGVTDELWLVIMELFLVVAVGSAIFNYVVYESSDLAYHKRFFARDLAYTLEAVEGLPGDIDFYYSPAGKEIPLTLSIFSPKVMMYKDLDDYKYVYRYPHDLSINPLSLVDRDFKQPISFSKQGNQVTVGVLAPLMEIQKSIQYVPYLTPTDEQDPEISLLAMYNMMLTPLFLKSTSPNVQISKEYLLFLDLYSQFQSKSATSNIFFYDCSKDCAQQISINAPYIGLSFVETSADPRIEIYHSGKTPKITLMASRLAKSLSNNLLEESVNFLDVGFDFKVHPIHAKPPLGFATQETSDKLISIWDRAEAVSVAIVVYYDETNSITINVNKLAPAIYGGIEKFFTEGTAELPKPVCEVERCKSLSLGRGVAPTPPLLGCDAFGGLDPNFKCADENSFCCLQKVTLCESENNGNDGSESDNFFCRVETECSDDLQDQLKSKIMCVGDNICCKGK
ncbi:hypothetical protein HN419_02020 [Candidatus Woesearchaeota archaeon]|nr:hypothetical protein [Candidatus Woesearchaeota archaeon]MBT3537226.1 hypothetical protein [Candidatus Woesearchaeota archaeon]MBT4698213.1 hypothetical protein [Candidatus Woesearchaeota archaeon]MBT4717742.1 hypothetical protein [Candidatus Woesearchaeota archaeon]MBT7106464.1 hypothetical protein [Candidatus Woesearchaeota archaeon]